MDLDKILDALKTEETSTTEETPVFQLEEQPNETTEETTKETQTEETITEETTVEETTTEEIEDPSIIESVITSFGYELPEGKTYDESPEGLNLLIKDIADSMAIETVNNYYSSSPIEKQFHDYLQNGGSPETFFKVITPESDYEKFEIKDDNDRKRVIFDYLTQVSNMSPEKAQSRISSWDSAGILDEEAETAHEEMKAFQAASKQEMFQRQEQERVNREKAVETYWTNLKKKLDESTTIKGLNIPMKEKNGLFEYMAFATENGNSQFDNDLASMDEETKIALAYIRKNNLNLSSIVSKEAQTINANKTKLKFKGQENVKKNEKPQGTATGTTADSLMTGLITYLNQQ